MNTHHPPHCTHRTLKPNRHTDLNKYYPHINLLIQLTLLLTLLLFLTYTQTTLSELHNLRIT